ncbi:tetratricopeptide repeat protein [Mesonia aestuariivivens]|uniref:Tetratricopeptide repeat protein n=1 Tax=Mesonia aestuariivivens TaxID=2796128 RepID=A0ABS6VYP3_9FLAO|nr:tetratricopeptide repeat protein [Mesonia aestuariivivens]MBW2960715.1 tetratricopeptide repeat protein [Mesonia aestuariivivens]
MNSKILALGFLLAGSTVFAQKKEIRNAEKAIDKGNFTEAKSILTSVETQVAGEKDRIKEDYYMAKGKAYMSNQPEKQSAADLKMAGEAFKMAKEFGNEDAAAKLADVKNALVNSAIADQNAEKYKESAKKLYTSYELNTQDTIHLYYAAASATNGKDFKTALKYYESLAKMNYSGAGIEYYAINKETGEKERFANEKQRDLYLKSGNYDDPSQEKIPSKKAEITKNIALIYIQEGETEKGLKAIEAAIKENPDDTSLMLAQADIYYKADQKDKYAEIVEKVLEKDPNNASLYYNLGVTATQMEAPEKAVAYYKKAIEVDPKMTSAYVNLASSILMQEQGMIDEMNSLGMSKADTKRYDELQKERSSLYEKAVPYLEKAVELDENNQDAIQTLINIHSQLGNDDKVATYKAMKN